MHYPWQRKLLFLLLVLLTETVYAAQLIKDGTGSSSAFPRTVYRAFNYRPFCGTLANAEILPWNTTEGTCGIPMATYRQSQDTFALYDTTGVRLDDTTPVGVGTELCMCYSLSEVTPVTGAPRQANFCTFVDRAGAEKLHTSSRALGTYEVGSKSMPQCFDIDIPAVTASLASAAGITGTAPTSTPRMTTSRSNSGAATGSSTPASSGGASQGGDTGASTESKSTLPGGPFAVGIWLPILISALAAIAGVVYKHKQYKLQKKKAQKLDDE